MTKEITIEELDAQLAEAIEEQKMLDILTRYRDRKITRLRAASLLHISERQVTRLMEEHGLERVVGARQLLDEAAAKRREMREAAAALAAAGKISVEQAALRAGCSVRTIYRYINKPS